MAHKPSAKKRLRQSTKRRARNRRRKGQIKQAVREFDDALRAGDTDRAGRQLKVVYKQLDQIAAKGTIHRNAAARKKARLTARLNKATG